MLDDEMKAAALPSPAPSSALAIRCELAKTSAKATRQPVACRDFLSPSIELLIIICPLGLWEKPGLWLDSQSETNAHGSGPEAQLIGS